MNKNTLIFGIDISKDTFDVFNSAYGHQCFSNNQKGFTSFAKLLENSSHCVMEATGCYHQRLAMYLHSKGFLVSVVNPLIIKRFIQMKLRRVKTDKSDALMIFNFANEQHLELWQPEADYIIKSKELLSILQTYSRQSTAIKNKIHSLVSRGATKGVMIRSLKRQLNNIKKEILLLEKELENLIKANEPILL